MAKHLNWKKFKHHYFRMDSLMLCLIVISLCFNISLGQGRVLDSLARKLKHFEVNIKEYKKNVKYIDLINELSYKYRNTKADSIYNLASKALQYSKEIDYVYGTSFALLNIGYSQSLKGESKKARTSFKHALSLADSAGVQHVKARIYNAVAKEYLYLGNYEKALKNYLTGLDIANEMDDKLYQSILNENIAQLYASQKEYDQALEFYNEVKKINSEIGDEVITAETLSNLAELYSNMGNYNLAMFNINRSIATFEKERIYFWLALSYRIKGDIYLHQKKYKWALYWFDQSNLVHRNIDHDREKIFVLNGSASAFLALGESELSKMYALKAYEVSSNVLSLEGKRDCAEILYKISKNNEEFEKALDYHEIYLQLTDSLNKDENKRSLSLHKGKLKYDKDKQLLIANNEKELAKQRNYINASIIIIIAILATAIPLYFNQKKFKKLYNELQINTESLRKNEAELNALNLTKNKLFSIIGHDLRGPIGALQALLKLMANGEIAKNDFPEFLPKLRSDVDHILFTLNNLLSWGHSQMKGKVSRRKMVNLNTLFKSSINLHSELANNKAIKIIDDLPEDCLALANENQVDVVIRNLLSNAIKFTPKNGLITMEAEETEKYWKVKIKDTGIGMDEKTQKKIFKENSNITTYGTNNERGTGLGLPLCKEMVAKNKGKIWVESVPYKGSTFFFTLPKITQKYRKAG